ncbi:MAG: hypothetical protein WD187_03455 [Candidatus Woykebacteria bacterium]
MQSTIPVDVEEAFAQVKAAILESFPESRVEIFASYEPDIWLVHVKTEVVSPFEVEAEVDDLIAQIMEEKDFAFSLSVQPSRSEFVAQIPG